MDAIRGLLVVLVLLSLWLAWWRGLRVASILPMRARRKKGISWLLVSTVTTALFAVIYMWATLVTSLNRAPSSMELQRDLLEPAFWFVVGLVWAYAGLGLWMEIWLAGDSKR